MNILPGETENINQYTLIPLIAEIIAEKIAPQKIILFGSCAKKCITTASDIDLCIVMEGKITPPQKMQIRRELLQDILEITDYEVDLFICGDDEWHKNYHNGGVMLGKIAREGELLYGGQ